jgi:endoglucanase
VHVQGDTLVDPAGEPLRLEGMVFGDPFWGSHPVREQHDGSDYARVAELGMNFVRLGFDAALLEEEAAVNGGLSWLDDNVAWAREHGLYLILALNVPPGGTPLDCGNDAFWGNLEYEERLTRLWRTVAGHFAGEPVIAGYAFLNAPNPSRSLDQWYELAERLRRAVREVDPEHTLFVGRAVSIGCVFDRSAEETFFRLADPNVVYEFDRLKPWYYVAQLSTPENARAGQELPEYGPYPDDTRFTIDWSKTEWLHASWDSLPTH